MAEDGEGFLARWSRLKQARREPAVPEPPPPEEAVPAEAPPEVAGEFQPARQPEPEPEPEIDLASLPRLEDLTATTDLSVFLGRGVPEALRNAALRRVWSLDPGIRDFIGPADYAWDWNVPGGAPGYAAEIASGPDVEALADRILGIVRDAPGEVGEPPERTAGETQATAAAPEAAPEPGPAEPVPLQPASEPPPPPPAEQPARPPAVAVSPPVHRARHGGAVPS